MRIRGGTISQWICELHLRCARLADPARFEYWRRQMISEFEQEFIMTMTPEMARAWLDRRDREHAAWRQ